MEVSLAPQSSTLTPPRGISARKLIDQIKNTAPFVFESDFVTSSSVSLSYLATVRKTASMLAQEPQLSHVEYFELCLAAHYTTCGTFVPTDVDSQIRFKLWHPSLSKDLISKMAFIVTKSYTWDSSAVSKRWITSPITGERLSGHCGEWLSTAIAAYGALRKRCPNCASDLTSLIVREVQKEAQIYEDFKKVKDGIGLLKAAALIAHNLGDLDRVVELWDLPEGDPLKAVVYKTGHRGGTQFGTALVEASRLNRNFMAAENHRHFALRTPRCLRKSAELLLPLGPFFDGWGNRIARHPGLSPEDVGRIAEALVDGFERLNGPIGYSRALAGIFEGFPGGLHELRHYVPARTYKSMKAGKLHSLCSVSRERFEEQWSQMALNSTQQTLQ